LYTNKYQRSPSRRLFINRLSHKNELGYTDWNFERLCDRLEFVKAAALCPAVDVVNCPYIDGIGVHM